MIRTLALDSDQITDLGLDLDLIKSDLRIAHSDLDELLWSELVPAAIARAEAFTHRAIVSRAFRWIIDQFPYRYDQMLLLPLGKVQAIASIAVSVNHVTTVLTGPTSGSPGTDYQEDLRGDRARVMPAVGTAWPIHDIDVPAPIVVTFTAGWTEGNIPADLRRGISAAVADQLDLDAQAINLEVPEKLLSAWRIG